MRLVDVDTLNKELQKRIGSPTDDKLYEVNLCIIDAPTIDAIPVGWIEGWRQDAIKRNDGLAKDMLDWLLGAWQKEQEAR